MGQRTVQYQNVFKVDPFESRLIDYRTIEDRKFIICKPVSYPLSPKPVPGSNRVFVIFFTSGSTFSNSLSFSFPFRFLFTRQSVDGYSTVL